jgi:hypothetical protein
MARSTVYSSSSFEFEWTYCSVESEGGGGSGEKVTAVEAVGGVGGASRRRQEPRLGLSGAAAVEELR